MNVAARLEGLAEPGGICVSGRVQEDVRGKLDIAFEDAGEQQLKNIASGAGLSLSDEGTQTRFRPCAARQAFDRRLAVHQHERRFRKDYFADGVAEETITALSRMEWLMVAARNSSFVYKGQAVDAQQVGRELGVCYVLEGSVRKAASRVRIAQLIELVHRGASLGAPFRGHAGGHLRSPGPGDG